MPSTKQFRDRIRSISNTAKVTGAMQLIAASRMQRSQQMVINGRAYADKMNAVLSGLAARAALRDEQLQIPLLDRREVKRTLMVLITPDRGLAGGLVGNLSRAAISYIRDTDAAVSVVAIGRKGERLMARTGQNLQATFTVQDRPRLEETVAIARMVIDQFESGAVDRAVVAYAQFVNTAVQRPVVQTLLPVEPATSEDSEGQAALVDYIYEPEPQRVLEDLVPRYVETEVYHSILEAQASEHSARMVAMKNATDNAHELIDDLTLELNKARQASITNELLDIVGGAAAIGT